MTSRDTTTGAVLEEMVLPALRRGGYAVHTQVLVGQRFGGGKHIVDVLAEHPSGHRLLISVKWQQVSGTTEQKVPFEAISLAEAILSSPASYARAYLVLGGHGWKLRDFFIGGGLNQHLRHGELVTIISLEQFVARANNGLL
jgi:hypothetical protein